MSAALNARIRDLARSCVNHKGPSGISTGERCAVALLLNDETWLPSGYSWIDAVDRLGEDWLAACLELNRSGWARPVEFDAQPLPNPLP
jgi:hypothetical protein